MEQLGFEGMPRRLYTCTPTRLSSWLDCPRRYRMSYLDRPSPPKGPPWAHNSVGASVHNALAGWWRLPMAQRTVAAAGNLVDRGWINEGFADETQSVRQRERAIAMVEGYVAGLDPADEPLGVERTVATRTDIIAVSGRIDRLDARPELVVVDYKTGRHLLTTDDARSSMALALYALAAGRVMRRDCHRVELHHLPTGEVLAWSHTAESLARRKSADIDSKKVGRRQRFVFRNVRPRLARRVLAEQQHHTSVEWGGTPRFRKAHLKARAGRGFRRCTAACCGDEPERYSKDRTTHANTPHL
jgi:RecB family exonuclease